MKYPNYKVHSCNKITCESTEQTPNFEVKMRYILGLPTDHVESIDQFGTSQAIAEMATTAETLGFSGVFVTDHPAPTKSFLDTGGSKNIWRSTRRLSNRMGSSIIALSKRSDAKLVLKCL